MGNIIVAFVELCARLAILFVTLIIGYAARKTDRPAVDGKPAFDLHRFLFVSKRRAE
jgi:hypothetical protein